MADTHDPTIAYVEGVRSGIRRAAAWLRDHGGDQVYEREYSCDCRAGGHGSVGAPDPEKLADAMDVEAAKDAP